MIHYYITRKKKTRTKSRKSLIHEIYKMRTGDYFLANRSSLVRKQVYLRNKCVGESERKMRKIVFHLMRVFVIKKDDEIAFEQKLDTHKINT